MSGLQTKVSSVKRKGSSSDEQLKDKLLCASDVARAFTHAEIDGVRRTTKIEYTSVSLDASEGAVIKLTRTFTYGVTDPFDLNSVNDILTVV